MKGETLIPATLRELRDNPGGFIAGLLFAAACAALLVLIYT